jgi:cytochrome c
MRRGRIELNQRFCRVFPACRKGLRLRMDSFELNKIIGAILGTLLFVMGAGFLAEAIYHPIEGRGPGYDLPEAEGAAHGGEAEPEVVVDIGTLLAAASVEQGEGVARRCAACHTFTEGGGNKAGPELFGVAGRQIASHAGYAYSPALQARASEAWTYENLDAFLLSPKGFAPDTKMGFGGLKDDRERANMIAYLASITPGAPAFPAPAPAAPAEGETAAADPAAPAAEGEAPAADPAAAPVSTDANAVETPTETQSETPVEGTAAPAPTTEAPATTETTPQ